MNRTRGIILGRHYFWEKDYMKDQPPREAGNYGKGESKR